MLSGRVTAAGTGDYCETQLSADAGLGEDGLGVSGNIMDASDFVLISALETVTLPSVTMDTDTGEVVVSDKKKLKLDSSLSKPRRCVQQHHYHLPLPVVRPHTRGGAAVQLSLVMVMTTDRDDCHLYQPGEDQLSPQLLQQAVQLATHREPLLH